MRRIVASLAFLVSACGSQPAASRLEAASIPLICANGTVMGDSIPAFKLANCAGKRSFLAAMIAPGGIKDLIDADGRREVAIADAGALARAAERFDPSVPAKTVRLFKDGEQGLEALLASLQGRTASPLTLPAVLRPKLNQATVSKPVPLAAVMLAPYLALASGAGAEVVLGGGNSFINVGYGPGDDEHDVKTGRTFGVSAARGALDPSDPFYLDELAVYLNAGERSAFYRALMQVLTASDPSGLSALSARGQTVLTDFVAIYAAELDRHAMSGFKQHPWENDLVEATWVAAYVVNSGKLFVGNRLTAGRTRDFFAMGERGGGIGETRRDRRALQAAISAFEWGKSDHAAIAELAALIGVAPGGDVFKGLAAHLSAPERTAEVLSASARVTAAAVRFLEAVGADHAAITASIHN